MVSLLPMSYKQSHRSIPERFSASRRSPHGFPHREAVVVVWLWPRSCEHSHRSIPVFRIDLTSISPISPASVAQLDAPSDWRPGGRGFNPRRGRQHSFVEIDHEIFSTVILSLPLNQEGQLSVSGERMCTILVNRLED